METTILIRAVLTTTNKVTERELDNILLDTTQVSNIITYDVIEKKIEDVRA